MLNESASRRVGGMGIFEGAQEVYIVREYKLGSVQYNSGRFLGDHNPRALAASLLGQRLETTAHFRSPPFRSRDPRLHHLL